MTDKEKEIEDNVTPSITEMPYPRIVQELICIKCGARFLDIRLDNGMWLKDLDCPKCGQVGFLIATGQDLKDVDNKR